MRLGAFDCDFEWIKGKENIADPPSRLCDRNCRPTEIDYEETSVLEISALTAVSGVLSLTELQNYSADDPVIQLVVKAMETGYWSPDIKRYESVCDDLQETKGLLLKSGAIVVPDMLKGKALALAHAGHPGQSAMKSIMRPRLWWPGMSLDILYYVESCFGCMLASRDSRPVPMLRSSLPEAPWEKLAIDFNGPHAAYGGRLVVVLVDYYSRYVMAEFIRSTDLASVTCFLSRIFASFGLPLSIRSDNGPPFNSAGWIQFCKANGILAEFSTPGFPQQNGLVERYMQLINKSLSIAFETAGDQEECLSETIAAHNAAVHRVTGVEPEVLLFGRRIRRKLPLLNPERVLVDLEALRERDALEKAKAQSAEDARRHARESSVSVGDTVLVKRVQKSKDQTRFAPERFAVVRAHRGDFVLESENAKTLSRNITDLRKVHAPLPQQLGEGPAPILDQQVPAGVTDDTRPPRPSRKRKPPAHLSDYVRNVNVNR